tara:strand:+ start:5340 stop:5744 length:405 start_codon:yes stop_codon:yes gene_type:complete
VSEDYNRIAQLEQEIKKKYGDDAIKNPLSSWDHGKEKEYIEQVKEVSTRDKSTSAGEKEYYNGFLVDKKLFNRDNKTDCPVCGQYSFSARDNVYLNKWDCCRICFIRWVEDREERWKAGWRPNVEDDNDQRDGE